jgi:peptidoglycan/xylan/chitin deacetylase (PgdA/CDA1 family)
MYHYVRDSAATPFPSIRALPPALFDQQLDWLQRHYAVVEPATFEAAAAGRETLPQNAALLTFDDGFVDHYRTVFPSLRRRGLSGVFFLAGDAGAESPRVLGVHKTHFLLARLGAEAFGRAVLEACEPAMAGADTARRRRIFGADRWEHADERAIKDLLNYELSFEEADRVLAELFERSLGDEAAFARELYLGEGMVAEMARGGMVFGYHTRSHRMLSRLPPAEQERELRDGVGWIRDLTGQASVSFCYPWGGPRTYTADTVRILAECGYSVAYNTVRRRVEVGRDPRFELPRVDTRDLPPYTAGEPVPAAASPGEEA